MYKYTLVVNKRLNKIKMPILPKNPPKSNKTKRKLKHYYFKMIRIFPN